MLENLRSSIAKLMEGTKDQALIDIYAGSIREIDDCEGKIRGIQEEHTNLQKKYVDLVLHCPVSNENPEGDNGDVKSLEDFMNIEVAKRSNNK